MEKVRYKKSTGRNQQAESGNEEDESFLKAKFFLKCNSKDQADNQDKKRLFIQFQNLW